MILKKLFRIAIQHIYCIGILAVSKLKPPPQQHKPKYKSIKNYANLQRAFI